MNYYLFYWIGRNIYNKTDFESNLIKYSSRYHCPNQCGRHYKGRDGLKRHLKHECGMVPKFSCSVCKRCFYYKDLYKFHMANIHKIILDS